MASLYACQQCGIPLSTKEWMKPGSDYWCWSCARRFLEEGKTERVEMAIKPINAAVGKALRRALLEADMTRAELAEAMGVSGATVGRYLKGQTQPSFEMMERLAEALGVPIVITFEPGLKIEVR